VWSDVVGKGERGFGQMRDRTGRGCDMMRMWRRVGWERVRADERRAETVWYYEGGDRGLILSGGCAQ
jgi:hypothetical protein